MEVKSTECSNNIKMNSNFNNDILEDESKLPKLSHRKRLRTKSTRIDLKNRLVSALLTPNTIQSLFQIQEDGYTMSAPLSEIFENLNLTKKLRFSSLSTMALKSISNATKIFSIQERKDPKTNKIELWMNVNTSLECASVDSIVYVDNLPPQCSEAHLRKRAMLFGTVINIKLPQITRIQRRIGSSKNSGFAFIQFASKTAARRICKRFSANSRLKRNKHSHKKKPKILEIKSNTSLGPPACSQQDTPNVSLNNITTTSSFNETIVTEVFAHPGNTKKFNSQEQTILTSSLIPDKKTISILNMSVEDSGNDTESEALNKSNRLLGFKNSIKKRKKRRKRHLQSNRSGNLSILLKRIQVYPYKHYRELREEYLRLQKENIYSLKRRLLEPPSPYESSPSIAEEAVFGGSPIDYREELGEDYFVRNTIKFQASTSNLEIKSSETDMMNTSTARNLENYDKENSQCQIRLVASNITNDSEEREVNNYNKRNRKALTKEAKIRKAERRKSNLRNRDDKILEKVARIHNAKISSFNLNE